MTAIPKPLPRGPKPRRPIRRSAGAAKRPGVFVAHHALQKLCDDTFTLWVRVRDKNRCRLCGSNFLTQGAHLISRRYKGPRWSGSNCWCLCKKCHARYTHDPLGWRALMVETFGVVEWERRELEAQIHTKPDLSVIRFALKQLLLHEIRGGDHGLDVQVEKILARHERMEHGDVR